MESYTCFCIPVPSIPVSYRQTMTAIENARLLNTGIQTNDADIDAVSLSEINMDMPPLVMDFRLGRHRVKANLGRLIRKGQFFRCKGDVHIVVMGHPCHGVRNANRSAPLDGRF